LKLEKWFVTSVKMDITEYMMAEAAIDVFMVLWSRFTRRSSKISTVKLILIMSVMCESTLAKVKYPSVGLRNKSLKTDGSDHKSKILQSCFFLVRIATGRITAQIDHHSSGSASTTEFAANGA
jgi:hypothetical protein